MEILEADELFTYVESAESYTWLDMIFRLEKSYTIKHLKNSLIL